MWQKNMRSILMAFTLALALVACSGAGGGPRSYSLDLPYRTWEIGLGAPNYMEVWVESVDVVDVRGFSFKRVHGGTSSIQNPPDNKGDPTGWPVRPGIGASRPMMGIDLPKEIFVRWQSLAEPQTYDARIDVPAWAREEMVTGHAAVCSLDGQHITAYRYAIAVGLAPGGIIKAWLTGACLDPIEIGRFVGTINPDGPSGGQTGGRYALPLDPAAQKYLETHEIPFDSW